MGFVISVIPVISANPALNSLFLAVQVVFVVFVVFLFSVVFVKGDPHANHRFGKPWVQKYPILQPENILEPGDRALAIRV